MQPLDTLAEHTSTTIQYHEKIQTKGFMPKVIVGQRVCKDGPTTLWQHIAGNEQRPKLVYEIDDDLWNVDASNNPAYQWFINGYDVPAKTYHNVPQNLIDNITVSDRVTVTTPALAKLVGQWNDNVVIVPNYIPEWVLGHERPRRDRVTVGWMGSSTHSMDWDQAAEPVHRFLQRNAQVDFHLMGGSYSEKFKLPKERLVSTPWIDGVENVWKAIDFDIALAPLRPHLFNQSKSNLKALEAAALGIPIVASDCGPYPGFVEHGKTGFLVRQDHEWGKFLRMLVNDHDMREEMGNNAREKARAWTLEGNIDQWAEALTKW
jgi:glycosyltransferase involved in cell wall biosynthesis